MVAFGDRQRAKGFHRNLEYYEDVFGCENPERDILDAVDCKTESSSDDEGPAKDAVRKKRAATRQARNKETMPQSNKEQNNAGRESVEKVEGQLSGSTAWANQFFTELREAAKGQSDTQERSTDRGFALTEDNLREHNLIKDNLCEQDLNQDNLNQDNIEHEHTVVEDDAFGEGPGSFEVDWPRQEPKQQKLEIVDLAGDDSEKEDSGFSDSRKSSSQGEVGKDSPEQQSPEPESEPGIPERTPFRQHRFGMFKAPPTPDPTSDNDVDTPSKPGKRRRRNKQESDERPAKLVAKEYNLRTRGNRKSSSEVRYTSDKRGVARIVTKSNKGSKPVAHPRLSKPLTRPRTKRVDEEALGKPLRRSRRISDMSSTSTTALVENDGTGAAGKNWKKRNQENQEKVDQFANKRAYVSKEDTLRRGNRPGLRSWRAEQAQTHSQTTGRRFLEMVLI